MQTTLHKYGHVNTGWASRLQSDRFLNSNEMLCPNWNSVDSTGRNAYVDSVYTKSAGCNSARDRVDVENANRSMTYDNVQLSNVGLLGNSDCIQKIVQVPQNQWNGIVADNRAYYSQASRDYQWLQLAARIQENKKLSGF